ncbi:MAG TPA: hypothetical protein VMU50_17015 [Polyangia bacterium]|nr:hypothetical protein [Polyangia bacterium]
MKHRRWIGGLSLLAWLASPLAPAQAADAAPTAADITRLDGEIARLQQELRDQRQLVLQLMQMQEALMHYLHAGGPPPGPLPSVPGAAPSATPPSGPGVAKAGAPDRAALNPTASVTGRIQISGKFPAEAYVYLEGPRAVSAHPPTIEIKQKDRQFVPAVAVVPLGAHVLFPNQDLILHNVFSNTPGDAFDAGPVKAGQTPKPVTLLKPGHVEIFCNIHSRMRADVLVVPNAHYTRVRPDGTFHLPGVPVGSRRIVLWAPDIKPVAQTVEVSPDGATVNLTAERRPSSPHTNKQGGAYGSYED